MPAKNTHQLSLQQQIDALIERCNLSRMVTEDGEIDSHIDVDAIVQSKEKITSSRPEAPGIYVYSAKEEGGFHTHAKNMSSSVVMDFSRFIMTSVSAPIVSVASALRHPKRTTTQKTNVQRALSSPQSNMTHIAHAGATPRTSSSASTRASEAPAPMVPKTRTLRAEEFSVHHSLLRNTTPTRIRIDPVSLWTWANLKRFVVVWVMLTGIASAMTLLLS